jgi:hypothetical protein
MYVLLFQDCVKLRQGSRTLSWTSKRAEELVSSTSKYCLYDAVPKL